MRYGRTNFNRAFCVAVLAVAFVFSAMLPAFAQVYIKESFKSEITPGVVYYFFKASVNGKPVKIHVTDINLNNSGMRVQPVLAWGKLHRLETVPSMAKRTGAVACINGSYFNRSSDSPFPVGFLMINGRVIYFSHAYRSAFGITKEGTPLVGYPRTRGSIYLTDSGKYFYLWGMNRDRKKNEAVVYTGEYGERTKTKYAQREIVVRNGVVQSIGTNNMTIPQDGFVISLHGDSMKYSSWFKQGTPVKLYFVIEAEWLRVYNALTGGPLLLSDGRVVLGSTQYEKFNRNMNQRNPVTAVGSTMYGHVLFAVADGRRSGYSVGLSYYELAQFMRSLGANNAIAMDGGGSSTMVVKGKTVNKPSDGSPRAVSNSICVFSNR